MSPCISDSAIQREDSLCWSWVFEVVLLIFFSVWHTTVIIQPLAMNHCFFHDYLLFLFRYHQIIVIQLQKGATPSKSPEAYVSSSLKGYSSSLPMGAPYIAAEFNDENKPIVFLVGDDEEYSRSKRKKRDTKFLNYRNVPLQPGTKYSVCQRAFINQVCIL